MFKVPIRILKSIGQVTWSKINIYAKESGIPIKTMELHDEVKKNPKAENLHLFCRRLPNLEDKIHLKGGRIVTP